MNERYTKDFREVLENLVNNNQYSKSNIFLFKVADEESKKNLLQILKNISTENTFDNKFNIFDFDWNKIRYSNIEPTTIIEKLYKSFIDKHQEWKDKFSDYEKIKIEWEDIKNKIESALEREPEDTTSLDLKAFRMDGIIDLMRMNEANPKDEDFIKVEDFLKSCLNSEEDIEFVKNIEENLAKNLGTGIENVAKDKPLIIFFDNYKINFEKEDEINFDYILRETIKNSSGNVVWVIAGKTNLYSSGLKNPQANKALLEVLEEEKDPDVIAIAIRLLKNFDNNLGVSQLVNFLDHADHFVREAALRELKNLFEKRPYQELILQKAVDKIIDLFCYDYISSVRDEAGKILKVIEKSTKFFENHQEKCEKIKRTLKLTEEEEEYVDTGEDKTLFEILSLLEDTNKNIDKREFYVKRLGKFPIKDIKYKLISLLENSEEESSIRKKVAELIGKNGEEVNDDDDNEQIINTLIKSLEFNDKNDRFVRKAAAIALTKLIPTVKIVDALNIAAREDVIKDVRNAAKDSLTKIRNKDGNTAEKKAELYINLIDIIDENWKSLTEFCNYEDMSNIYNQIEAIKELKSKYSDVQNSAAVINAFINALKNDKDPNVCAAAASTLGNIPLKTEDFSGVLKLLLKKIDHKKKETGEYYEDRIAREAAVKAIGKLDTKTEELKKQIEEQKVVEDLINIWRNEAISNVREQVEPALENILKRTKNLDAYKALVRHSNKDKEYYQKFLEDNS